MKIIKLSITLLLFACLATPSLAGNHDQSTNSRPYIKEKFGRVLKEQIGVEMTRVTENARFHEELSCDATDLIELMMAVEEYFDIELSGEDWAKATTIKSAIDLIYDHKNTNPW